MGENKMKGIAFFALKEGLHHVGMMNTRIVQHKHDESVGIFLFQQAQKSRNVSALADDAR
ncbi:hypothetical protein JS44_15485 [Anoxybacillus flavithermus]|uniref:Uncharacterized protein n=1 Tax=Anoxybacillus flavithermus TaxID=33934 RepID=A0A094J297_9BACL|nr:hypothetical protein JS44_15485 [Anoxybacillus flavithermus]